MRALNVNRAGSLIRVIRAIRGCLTSYTRPSAWRGLVAPGHDDENFVADFNHQGARPEQLLQRSAERLVLGSDSELHLRVDRTLPSVVVHVDAYHASHTI